jgi:MFS family permease
MQNPLIQALRIPSFLFLVISEFFSQFAMNLLNFILLIVAFQLSSSNLAVAGVVLAFTLPSIFFGVIAGVYVDKWDKKKVLVYTNILRAIAVFFLIFVSHELFLVYFLTFMVALITQFFVPAETPTIPHLVPKNLLLSANAIFSMGIFGSIIVAYALSGPLLLALGKVNVFIFITIMFAVSAFFAALIKLKHSKSIAGKQKINVKAEVKEAFSAMRGNKKIFHSLFLLVLLQTLILVIAVIGPGYATNILHIQVEKFPLLFVTPAVIGMTAGAIIIGNFLHNKSKQMLAKIGLLIIGIMLILIPNLTRFIHSFKPVDVMIPLAVIIGFAFALVFVPSNTIIQEETTDEQRGKVYGSLNNLVGIVSLIPVLGVGVLADKLGVAMVISLIGVGVIIIAAIRFLKFE